MSKKQYLKGGHAVVETMHQINFWVDECYGKTDKVFKHEDGTTRDNKVVKEVLKFLAAYEVIANIPPEFRGIKPDLELSIATAHELSLIHISEPTRPY